MTQVKSESIFAHSHLGAPVGRAMLHRDKMRRWDKHKIPAPDK
jgi:hypothetical protein